jgi:hypothetical protein
LDEACALLRECAGDVDAVFVVDTGYEDPLAEEIGIGTLQLETVERAHQHRALSSNTRGTIRGADATEPIRS